MCGMVLWGDHHPRPSGAHPTRTAQPGDACRGGAGALGGGGQSQPDQCAARLKARDVTVQVPGVGVVTGDVAWGGNWFFLVNNHGQTLSRENIPRLLEVSGNIRQAVNAQGHPKVDHVELFGPPQSGGNSRNFVLCPGGAYDRSPCGTGTSAKLASLATRGLLEPGTPWFRKASSAAPSPPPTPGWTAGPAPFCPASAARRMCARKPRFCSTIPTPSAGVSGEMGV